MLLVALALAGSDGPGPDGRSARIDPGPTLVVETRSGEVRVALDPSRPLAAWSPGGAWLCASGPITDGVRALSCVAAGGEVRSWQTRRDAEPWVLVATDNGEIGLGLADGDVLVAGDGPEVERFHTRGLPRPGVVIVAVGATEVIARDARRKTWHFVRGTAPRRAPDRPPG